MNWKKEYLNLLKASWGNAAIRDEALGLKAARSPARLFRYRRFDDQGRWRELLETGLTWLSSPSALNDPFDSSFSVSMEKIREGHRHFDIPPCVDFIREYLTEEEAELVAGSNDPMDLLTDFVLGKDLRLTSEERTRFKNTLLRIQSDSTRKITADFIELIRDHLRICCFSENPTSILLWSHYADYHKGFCLEYLVPDLYRDDVVFRSLHPVVYSDRFPDMTDTLMTARSLGTWPIVGSCSKSSDWSYEAEWRFIAAFGILNHSPRIALGKPNRIILGAKIEEDNELLIGEAADSLGIPVERASLAKDEFKIVVD